MKYDVDKIKKKLEFWFLKYYRKTKNEFDGAEVFTLFELLDLNYRNSLLKKIPLNKEEIPVLVLKVSDKEVIVNTTHKFIKLTDLGIECLKYQNFEQHNGYKSIAVQDNSGTKPISVKTNGYISVFGLQKKSGEIIYWDIPTGSAGFGFWNVTAKCEIVGRKYLS